MLVKGMLNTQETPARIWRRGQTVTIKWARNNHNNGLMRFAIVPVAKMMDRSWHKKLAIYDGCWAQGAFSCRGRQCGADMAGIAFKREIEIPSIYPDGDYVFAMVWYGGAHLPLKKRTFFSDYFSCSFIRIEGGIEVGGSYQPFFSTGNTFNRMRGRIEGTCFSAVDEPGICPKRGCKGPAKWIVPRRFKDGKMPDPISVDTVREAME